MAISTYPVKLYYDVSGTDTELCEIKSFPDLGAAPDALETTTLSDAMRTYIAGIQDTQQMEFTANYTKSDYTTINGLSGTQAFKLKFGTAGADGVFSFSGSIMAYVNGAGVNEVVEMTIVITPSTVISVS